METFQIWLYKYVFLPLINTLQNTIFSLWNSLGTCNSGIRARFWKKTLKCLVQTLVTHRVMNSCNSSRNLGEPRRVRRAWSVTWQSADDLAECLACQSCVGPQVDWTWLIVERWFWKPPDTTRWWYLKYAMSHHIESQPHNFMLKDFSKLPPGTTVHVKSQWVKWCRIPIDLCGHVR